MRLPQLAEDAVQVVLLARCRHAAIAAGPVAQHFGLSLQAAEVLLEHGRGVIVPRMPLSAVRRVMPLLAVLGVQVAVQSVQAEPAARTFDLSLRLLETDAANDAARALKQLGVGRAVIPADFAGPKGLELRDLPESLAVTMTSTLRRMGHVQVTVCASTEALYDLFALEAAVTTDFAALRRHLAVLGCQANGPGAALATGLDRRVLAHVLARFPLLGLYGVNQAFQRYDLRLVGRGRLTSHELQDFLFTRGFRGAEAELALASDQGLRMESGLSRAAAGQFLADYATIGLPVRAELLCG